MGVLIVTGTGTDVGKTVATAALAACGPARVAVVKPAQTGAEPGAAADLAEVQRLSGRGPGVEYARYPDPLSPHHAAAVRGLPELDPGCVVAGIEALDREHDLVLVEGAGGLLVPYTRTGWTLLELAVTLSAQVVVVTTAGLGTLNHTALTVRALRQAGVEPAGLIIGSWPAGAGLVERCNVADLAALCGGGELAGALPAGMATMRDFPGQARAAVGPQFGGTFDGPAFRAAASRGVTV